MKMLKDLEEVVRLREEAEYAARMKSSDEWMDADVAVNNAALEFLRTHAAEIDRNARDAERYRMCISNHKLSNNERIECHINVGVNVWRGRDWISFHECSPDELQQIITAMREGGGE